MWLLTPDGFYSVVKPRDHDQLFCRHGHAGDLVVRSRAAKDLTMLRRKWLPELGKTITTPVNRDYGYRAFVQADYLARAMARITLSIDYDNYKDEVHVRQGAERAGIYSRIWHVLTDIQYGPVKRGRYSAFGPVEGEHPALFDLDQSDFDEDDWWRRMEASTTDDDEPLKLVADG